MDFANDNEIKYAHDILLSGLPNFDDEKVAIIKCNESKDIKACPGSGKTTTLLAKLIILAKRMPLNDGKGICVLTHTNVAIDEIKSKLNSQTKVLFNYPNYFGTIQGFVDKFLTIPYYNSTSEKQLSIIDDDKAEMIFDKAFKTKSYSELKPLWGQIKDRISQGLSKKEEYNEIRKVQKKLLYDSYYDVNSQKYYRKYGISKALAQDKTKPIYKLLDTTRGACLKEGVLKYEDAFSYAIAYAKQYKILKDAISERFCYLFIDEMQDTKDIQYDLIEMLFDRSKVIIQRFGDPHQSIFEFGNMKWNPDKTALPINMSNRFGNNIAAILKTVCETDNKALKGNTEILSLKPILIVYDDPKTVLPKFAQLVRKYKVDGKTILDIANEMRLKDPLKKHRIKAIGWVGKDKNDGMYRISSYYANYEQTSNIGSKKNPSVLYDFLRKTDNLSVKECSDRIFTALAAILELSGIMYSYNGKSVRYTKSRVKEYLKNVYPDKYQALRTNIANWTIGILNAKSIINKNTYDKVQRYIEKDFQYIFQFDKTTSAYSEFMVEPNKMLCEEIGSKSVAPNIFIDGDVEIEVGTIHSVKGETHVATLYMETAYRSKYESQQISEQLYGIPYTGTKEVIKLTLRIAYVAMSRPMYMLCMAIKKENYEQLDKDRLSHLWETIEI